MKSMALVWAVMFIFNALSSFTHIAGKEAVMHVSPWAVGFYRFVMGAVTMWLLMRAAGRTIVLEASDRWRFLTLAVLAVPLNQLSFLVGIHHTPASHPALLYATTPAWVLLFALALGIERLRWWKWTGVALALIGVVILLGGEVTTVHRQVAGGDVILLLAVLSWSLYTALGKPVVERYGALETTFVVMVFGALLYFPFGLYLAWTADYSGADTSVWLGIVYMGVITSGVAYFLWYWMLQRIRPSQVAVVTCAQPPTTAFLAWLAFGTAPTGNLLLSGAMILAGIVLMVGYGGPKRSMPASIKAE
ncbi:MAG: DMT family transporter [Fidelibacterota bacterium]